MVLEVNKMYKNIYKSGHLGTNWAVPRFEGKTLKNSGFTNLGTDSAGERRGKKGKI